MKSKIARYITAIFGLLLLAVGLYLLKTDGDSQTAQGIMRYVFIGFGCGLFGNGMSNMISERTIGKDPDLVKKTEIEKNDERNVAIANKAKGKAFDLMTFVFGALMVAFGIIGVDTAALLLLVFAYLFVHGYAIYYRFKFDKEM